LIGGVSRVGARPVRQRGNGSEAGRERVDPPITEDGSADEISLTIVPRPGDQLLPRRLDELNS
jgi:hypothetical protein